jgi:hypothetical protein
MRSAWEVGETRDDRLGESEVPLKPTMHQCKLSPLVECQHTVMISNLTLA